MARPRNRLPSYIPHSQTGRARAIWTDLLGIRRERLLPGQFDSQESRTAFAQLQLELSSTHGAPPVPLEALTVAEVLLSYATFAQTYYVGADGFPTAELTCMKAAIKPLRELYADLPAIKFGPLALRAVRQRLIESGLCRRQVNQRIDRIKRVFKWATSEELVPAATYHALQTLSGLRQGRCGVREAEPVKPVSDELVRATLPLLPPHVRCAVELMWHTGMRPSEVCNMTLGQIDRAGATWTYRPQNHKTLYAGKARVVQLGPKACAVLVDFLRGRSLAPDQVLFSPVRQREERFAALRSTRRTKVQPSQVCRKRSKPKKLPGERYTPTAICRAVAYSCKKAKLEHWFPYQLRHAFATRVRKEAGLEAAQVMLGHSRADVTQIYAEKNEALGATIAAKIG
ncbi:MAG: tyrosine-type recombinase/integrase [Gemmataceae bacterium]